MLSDEEYCQIQVRYHETEDQKMKDLLIRELVAGSYDWMRKMAGIKSRSYQNQVGLAADGSRQVMENHTPTSIVDSLSEELLSSFDFPKASDGSFLYPTFEDFKWRVLRRIKPILRKKLSRDLQSYATDTEGNVLTGNLESSFQVFTPDYAEWKQFRVRIGKDEKLRTELEELLKKLQNEKKFLPEDCRLIRLYLIENHTREESAKRMGISADFVYRRVPDLLDTIQQSPEIQKMFAEVFKNRNARRNKALAQRGNMAEPSSVDDYIVKDLANYFYSILRERMEANKLTVEEYQLIDMFYLKDMTYKEIASELKLTYRAVTNRFYRLISRVSNYPEFRSIREDYGM